MAAMNILNCLMAFIVASMYFKNAIECKSIYRPLKIITGIDIIVIAVIYALFIFEVPVHPMIVKINTTMILALFGGYAYISRRRHGNSQRR